MTKLKVGSITLIVNGYYINNGRLAFPQISRHLRCSTEMENLRCKGRKYTAEFKSEAVKQVVDKGHTVVDVASRLGLGEGVLYNWVRKSKAADGVPVGDMRAMQAEVAKLKAELRRTTEERDILKKAAAYFAKQSG